MTSDSITMLSDKIDAVKDDLVREVAGINARLDQMNIWMLNRPPPCPEPGLCIVLRSRVDAQQDQIQRMQVALSKLQAWQSWMMGGMGLLMIGLTLFAPTIRAFFRIP